MWVADEGGKRFSHHCVLQLGQLENSLKGEFGKRFGTARSKNSFIQTPVKQQRKCLTPNLLQINPKHKSNRPYRRQGKVAERSDVP